MSPEDRELFPQPKLSTVDAKELLPANLTEQIPVVGKVEVLSYRPRDGEIVFAAFDEAVIKWAKVNENFQYIEAVESFKHYKSMAVGKDRTRRPLMHGSLTELSPELLFAGMFETNKEFRGKGMGVVYQENLYLVAKKLGYRFVAGYQNDPETAKFFLNRGRYLLQEIKNEFRADFQKLYEEEDDESVLYTVKFLYESDIKKIVLPERIGSSADNKIEYWEKNLVLGLIFKKLEHLLSILANKKQRLGDVATLIEVLDDLNNSLPDELQHKHTDLEQDDPNIVSILHEIIANLKSKKSELLKHLSLEQLKENDEAI